MKKGFTLIELLIVIGILAVLGTVAVLVINPGELLAQARDSQRISDLGTVYAALGLYVSTVGSFDVASGTADTQCVSSVNTQVASCIGRYTSDGTPPTTSSSPSAANLRKVEGSGWVAAGLSDVPGGTPLSILPIDPTNNDTYFYTYWGHQANKKFKLTSNLESVRYSFGGGDDKEGNDGGVSTSIYEVGNDLNMP